MDLKKMKLLKKLIAKFIGVAPLGDTHIEGMTQNKKTLKEHNYGQTQGEAVEKQVLFNQ